MALSRAGRSIATDGALFILFRFIGTLFDLFSYLWLEGISDFEGNRPMNHRLKSRLGNNGGIK